MLPVTFVFPRHPSTEIYESNTDPIDVRSTSIYASFFNVSPLWEADLEKQLRYLALRARASSTLRWCHAQRATVLPRFSILLGRDS